MASRALATAFVNVVPGTADFEKVLKGQLSGQMPRVGQTAGQQLGSSFKSRFGSAIRGIAAPLTAAFSVYAATDFLKGAITGASDLNEQMSASKSIFGSASGAIDAYASTATTKLGQTKTQVYEASKQFGIFGKAAGLTATDNATFSTSLVGLATDLASFNNTTVDEALSALGSGLRGEAEPLRKYGVLLDDASLKAQAMKMGIYDGNGPLDQQTKILAANAAIFAQTNTQQGDFAKTSGGLANQQRILSASWSDAQSTLGQSLLPTMTTLVGYLNTNVIPAIKTFFEDFKNGKTPLNDIIAGVQNFIGYIQANWSWISSLGVAVLVAVGAWKLWTTAIIVHGAIVKGWAVLQATMAGMMALWKVATGQATLAQLGLNMAMLANPIALIVIAIAALVAGLIWFFTQTDVGKEMWSNFVSFLTDLWNGILSFFSGLWDGIVAFFQGAVDFIWNLFLNWTIYGLIIQNWDAIVKFFSDVWNNIVGFFKAALAWVVQMFLDWTVYGFIIKNWNNILNFFKGVWDNIVGFFIGAANAIGDGWNKAIAFFKSIPGKILGFFAGAGKWLLDTGKNIIQGLLDGAGSLLKNIGSFFLNMLPGWIVGPFKSALGIHSPSKVFHEFGKNIIQGLVGGLTGDAASVKDTMKKVSDWVIKAFDDGKLSKSAEKAALKLVKAYSTKLNALAKAHDKVVAQLKTATDELGAAIKEKADFIKGVSDKFNADLGDSANSGDAIKALQDRISKNKELLAVLGDLQKLGLSGGLYKQILESGNLDLAKSIQAGGAETVTQLNDLAKEANSTAKALAEQGGAFLFDQGISVAQGIVDGLKAKEAVLKAQMERLAEAFKDRLSVIIQKGLLPDPPSGNPTAPSNVNADGTVVQSVDASGGSTGSGYNTTTLAGILAASGIPKMASGGFVNKPTTALIGEAGPEVVTPLKDFERMMGLGDTSSKTIVYNAAPNQSLDSEQALFTAIKRAKVVAQW